MSNQPDTIEVAIHRLTSGVTRVGDSVRAPLFGRLVDLAVPVVESYRSDLFHDAHWLTEQVTDACVFYYGVRSTGTSIGTDFDLVSQMNDWVYRLELIVQQGDRWYLNIRQFKLGETK